MGSNYNGPQLLFWKFKSNTSGGHDVGESWSNKSFFKFPPSKLLSKRNSIPIWGISQRQVKRNPRRGSIGYWVTMVYQWLHCSFYSSHLSFRPNPISHPYIIKRLSQKISLQPARIVFSVSPKEIPGLYLVNIWAGLDNLQRVTCVWSLAMKENCNILAVCSEKRPDVAQSTFPSCPELKPLFLY